MQKTERYKKFISYFSIHSPHAETELHYHSNAFHLLIAVILSAQCTDKRVNLITPPLFKKFPHPESLAKSSYSKVFKFIRTCSYPNNKAKHLVEMARMLVNEFDSEVPSDVEELQKLPGVGRKTANVIASVVFKKPAMAVDTHVFRVAERIGLTINAKNPYDSEMQLVENIPEDKIPDAHHWLILHGRYICTARKPKCHECGIADICKFFNIFKKKNTNAHN
ncbi:MAG: endonuclease III [Bacteroidota bacterium]